MMRRVRGRRVVVVCVAVVLVVVGVAVAARRDPASERTAGGADEQRFETVAQAIRDGCARLVAGSSTPRDRQSVRTAIADLAAFSKRHADASFEEIAPGAGDYPVASAVSLTAWDTFCPARERRALHRIVPVPAEPTELKKRERVAFWLARTDLRERCRRPRPNAPDVQAARRDVATLARVANGWPDEWESLGFVRHEAVGGTAETLGPYFNIEACRIREVRRLLTQAIPAGADSVFD
jgi:hypothetical protein